MRRLPQKKIHFYLSKVIDILRINLVAWILEFVLLLVYFYIYQSVIPKANQSAMVWTDYVHSMWFRFFYPIENWVEWIRPISFLILVPCFALLVALISKTTKRRFKGIAVILMAIVTLVVSMEVTVVSVVVLPIVTVLVVMTGLYYD